MPVGKPKRRRNKSKQSRKEQGDKEHSVAFQRKYKADHKNIYAGLYGNFYKIRTLYDIGIIKAGGFFNRFHKQPYADKEEHCKGQPYGNMPFNIVKQFADDKT